MTNERMNEIVKLSREAAKDLIRQQAQAGVSVEWNQARTASIQAAAVMACTSLNEWKAETIELLADDGSKREVATTKVLNRALCLILDSWLAQGSTQQKFAVKEGIYKAPAGKANAIVADALSGI